MLRAPLRAALLVPLALVVLLLPACGDDGTPQAGTTSSPSPTGRPLDGTVWRLTTLPDGTAVDDSVTASASFDSGTVSGSGGCNQFSAGYTVDGESLTIDPAAATLMACEGPAMTTESAFLPALEKVASYRTSADSLTLVDASGAELLVFAVTEPVELVGTAWQATSINNGKDAVQSLVTGTTVTAEFGADGQVSGNGGCNRFMGPYTSEGDTVEIGPLAGTKKACPEPAGVAEQETAFLAAMEAASTYTIVGSSLELRDDEGALQVAFLPAG